MLKKLKKMEEKITTGN
jgi:flagellar motility protein MotE (MotC chaperone)